ncbi:DUF3108 domain-containing protein [Fuscibacter oryzae]|uniref:DUF3108 domain-containing protein n=1 Tax=Fuscibacter oryzae TaxID=2803939 RepID=A0A8J7MW35_9RHOB|nr:DUF3108 domain-containing protein [Fuscibacter oryzae]MBL4928934.1 DUF3108 domain-containing protein [Fuscibacter oryzae]
MLTSGGGQVGLREIVLALCLVAGGTARAETFDFDLTYGPLRVGRLTLQATQGKAGYEARLMIRSAGLAGVVRAVRFEAAAVGMADQGLQPQSYAESADTGRRVSTARLRWQADGVQVVAYRADPAEEVAPAVASAGVLDPASAILLVLSAVQCGQRLQVFDGQRLSSLVLEATQTGPEGVACTGRFIRVDGYRPQDMDERRQFALRLTYGSDGVGMALAGAEVQTLYGKVRLKRR